MYLAFYFLTYNFTVEQHCTDRKQSEGEVLVELSVLRSPEPKTVFLSKCMSVCRAKKLLLVTIISTGSECRCPIRFFETFNT